jgi:hypothetical protein
MFRHSAQVMDSARIQPLRRISFHARSFGVTAALLPFSCLCPIKARTFSHALKRKPPSFQLEKPYGMGLEQWRPLNFNSVFQFSRLTAENISD